MVFTLSASAMVGSAILVTSAKGSPVCIDGVPLKPDPKFAAAKMPKLAASQPVPTCGMGPCTAQQLAAGPTKCSVTHLKPLPAPKGQPTKYSKADQDAD